MQQQTHSQVSRIAWLAGLDKLMSRLRDAVEIDDKDNVRRTVRLIQVQVEQPEVRGFLDGLTPDEFIKKVLCGEKKSPTPCTNRS